MRTNFILVALVGAGLLSGCGGETTTTVTEGAEPATTAGVDSPTGCVNVSSGEPEDCDAPGAVDTNVYNEANDLPQVGEEPTTSTTTAIEEDSGVIDCGALRKDDFAEGKCELNDRTFKVVNSDSILELEELTVELLGTETADILTDVGVERPNGVFLIFTLAVTNELSQPVQFSADNSQTTYSANGNEYTEDFDASNGGDTNSFQWQFEDIQPGTTQTGTVIFDVPQEAVEGLEKDGNLSVLNFSDAEFLAGRPKLPVGVFRTYAP